MKKTIDDLNLKGKKILVRVDFNVPIKNGIVQSDKRIKASLPTIKKIINDGGKVIIFSHLGRIINKEDKIKNNLKPISILLSKFLNKKVKFSNETRGNNLEKKINNMKNSDVLMIQNTRYEDLNNKAESENNLELGKY
jgi:phosphoglycerate kinase